MTFSPAKSDPSGILEEIERRCLKLEEPKSYRIGKSFSQPLLPQNILVFHRTNRADLQLAAAFRHQHHRYVLITAVRKAGEIGVDTHIHPISEGQSLLVFPFQVHWYVNLSSAPIHWVFVTFEHERDARLEALRDQGALRTHRGDLEPLRDVLRALQTPSAHDTLRPYLSLWLHSLSLRVGQKRREPVASQSAVTGDGGWLSEINGIVFENREKTPSLAQIARRLKVSASLLRSRFRRLTGKSVGRYVRELKLQYACELLHDTRLSITEIAQQCGYDSVFSFSRAFHKSYAFPPTSYRKKYQLVVSSGDRRGVVAH